jgi:thiamine-phosphate pyrophosphorylase
VGPDRLIGVSTHSVAQARQAVHDGADYLGCGPTFPSPTKQFADFPGLDFLRTAGPELQVPAFAIGGIHSTNVAQVLAAGFRRIAVSAAVTAASEPATAARSLLERLRP